MTDKQMNKIEKMNTYCCDKCGGKIVFFKDDSRIEVTIKNGKETKILKCKNCF